VSLLIPNGVFIGSVPTTPSVDANPRHLHDSRERSFRRMVERHGLQEIDCLRQVQPFRLMSVLKRRESRARDVRPFILLGSSIEPRAKSMVNPYLWLHQPLHHDRLEDGRLKPGLCVIVFYAFVKAAFALLAVTLDDRVRVNLPPAARVGGHDSGRILFIDALVNHQVP
jgi:hypothetical protein